MCSDEAVGCRCIRREELPFAVHHAGEDSDLAAAQCLRRARRIVECGLHAGEEQPLLWIHQLRFPGRYPEV